MAEASIGRRMLSEIEETSLDEILTALRTSFNSTTHDATSIAAGSNALPPACASRPGKSYPIPELDALVSRHLKATQSAPLSVSGRYLPLIYVLVATLISPPYDKALVVIDVEGRFDASRVLQCAPFRPASSSAPVTHATHVTQQDLQHIHVYRPASSSPSLLRDTLASAEHHMVYAQHVSVAREWWGTIVVGGGSPAVLGPAGADVTTGWKGWLRVDREEVRGFAVGMSVEEALAERDRRQRVQDESRWMAACVWGSFPFSESHGHDSDK